LEITRTTQGTHSCQRKYFLDILIDSGMLVTKPCCTTITKDTKHMYEQSKYIYEANSYWRLIGHLLYQTNTRPNI